MIAGADVLVCMCAICLIPELELTKEIFIIRKENHILSPLFVHNIHKISLLTTFPCSLLSRSIALFVVCASAPSPKWSTPIPSEGLKIIIIIKKE